MKRLIVMGIEKTVAITGGAGFIGKALVEAHLARGDKVRILSRRAGVERYGIRHFKGDLTCADDHNILKEFSSGVDILYHCAGELRDESLMESLHVRGTKRLLDASQGNIGRWVQLSSVGAYGPCRAGIVENTTLERPIGVYEVTKTESDYLVKKSGLKYTILRPSIVFGVSMPNRSLMQLTQMIRKRLFFYVGCDALVSYVHIDDVVTALLLCAEREGAVGKTFILSDTTRLEHMVAALAEGIGVSPPSLRFSERPVRLLTKLFSMVPNFPLTESRLDALTGHCCYDSSAIQRELGFSFSSQLDMAFRNYAKSIR